MVMDYFSRYVEAEILRSTTSEVIIQRLSAQFACHGVPVSIRTDNEPQFVSSVFRDFLKQIGIYHRRSIPLWPQTNGEVECQLENRSLFKAMKIAQSDGKDWRQELPI